MNKEEITIVCYGKATKWSDRKLAIQEYTTAVLCSEGSECERYSKILAELIDNRMYCSDE